jgi:hypothetical protein
VLALRATLLKLRMVRFARLALLFGFAVLLATLLRFTLLAMLRLALLTALLMLALLAILLCVALVAVLLMLAWLTILLGLALLAILLMLALVEAAAAVALRSAVELGPLLLLTVFPGAVAPALIAAARNKPAHCLDHAEIMVGVLPVGLGRNPIARGGGFACKRLVLVEDLVCIAAHTHIRTTAIENLVSIGRAVRIVSMLLLVLIVATATAASATAAATRPLPIVWSH